MESSLPNLTLEHGKKGFRAGIVVTMLRRKYKFVEKGYLDLQWKLNLRMLGW